MKSQPSRTGKTEPLYRKTARDLKKEEKRRKLGKQRTRRSRFPSAESLDDGTGNPARHRQEDPCQKKKACSTG